VLRGRQVLGFGALAVDDIIYVDRPLSAGKGRVTARLTDHGGNVATALVAVARLGGRAGFIGWLNMDDPAAHELARHGVDISLAPQRADARAIRSVITVGSDGERFIAYDDAAPQGTSDDLADATLAGAGVLLVDAYAIHSLAVVARARKLGLVVVADVEWSVGAATDRLLALADHLALPLEFARSHTGEADAAAILRKLSAERAAVVLTAGDQGCHLWQQGDERIWHIPAHPVRAVDTTGAGDCFHGAYALALAEGKSPLDAALYASAAAALSVTGQGGRRSLPGHDSCLALMAAAEAPAPVVLAPKAE
jgi:sugar/nucleoside kinase (ribokinase family)